MAAADEQQEGQELRHVHRRVAHDPAPVERHVRAAHDRDRIPPVRPVLVHHQYLDDHQILRRDDAELLAEDLLFSAALDHLEVHGDRHAADVYAEHQVHQRVVVPRLIEPARIGALDDKAGLAQAFQGFLRVLLRDEEVYVLRRPLVIVYPHCDSAADDVRHPEFFDDIPRANEYRHAFFESHPLTFQAARRTSPRWRSKRRFISSTVVASSGLRSALMGVTIRGNLRA